MKPTPAKTLTKSFQPPKPRRRIVRISVLGGCCYLDSKPSDVTVIIKDEDNQPPTTDTYK